jgi:hypothetical protein
MVSISASAHGDYFVMGAGAVLDDILRELMFFQRVAWSG